MPRKTHFGKSDYSTLSTPFYNKTASFNHVMVAAVTRGLQ